MVVGVLSWQLSLPGCGSLKEKRSVIRSLKERLKHRFNVSVAETAHQDTWTRAELTVALVSPDRSFATTALDKIDRFVAGNGRAIILDTYRELY
jgi:uncharacterized protein YlxP (DUF503 family)